MKTINYKAYIVEATKITLVSLCIISIFYFLHEPNTTLVIVMNMAVMSAVATFSIEQKHLRHVALGSAAMISSIVVGGILGFYFPFTAKIVTIIYAGAAFYLPRFKYQLNIFVLSAVMFLIFSALPFSLVDGVKYALDGIIVFIVFIGFYLLFDRMQLKAIDDELIYGNQIVNNHITAIIAILSLILSWSVGYFLAYNYTISHLYWIEITALLVIQCSQQKTIHTSIKRILANAIGAIIIVILYNYVMPPTFLINLLLLVVFVFLIFSLSFSYTARTLFVELFVLGSAHLMGDYQNAIALDRVILTFIGGMIVIVMTMVVYYLEDKFERPRFR